MVSFSRRPSDAAVAASIRPAVVPLARFDDYACVLSFIGDSPLVLLGEATHGTHDFYVARAQLTRLLIEKRGFSAVAIEGDWPDAYRVNRYVQAHGGHDDPEQALSGFERFPTWMWRNTAVAEFVAWLRRFNARRLSPESRVGFYGLDLYSLHASMREVVSYLDSRDPAAAKAARASYACFDQFGSDSDTYAWASARLEEGSCEEAVTKQLLAMRERRVELLRRDGIAADDEFFYAEQNARLARNAERYYRTMFRGRVSSWNVRDEHMAETLEQLLLHLRRRGQPARVVVWAHNSHLGDARATAMADDGELNLGQLTRERHGTEAKLIGFTTHSGTVIAASDWGEPAERKRVRPALPGSYEELFHRVELPRFFLPMPPSGAACEVLSPRRLERAIGVIYRPETERLSHYFSAEIAAQFDAVIHFDETHALQPLDEVQWPEHEEVPETYPTGV
jgi:erythromycin esterase-like protein